MKRDVVDDLNELIHKDLLERLPPDTSGELTAMNTAELVIVYLNWRGRFITSAPRRVHIASEMLTSIEYAAHKDVLHQLVKRIKAGEDLTPQLSRGVAVAHTPMNARNLRTTKRHLDLLLAEWGIHHLHLSLKLESDGFSHRTGNLLFAVFQPTDAYLISVFPHDAWTRRALAERCVRNWPSAGLFHAVHGVTGLVEEVDEANHRALRNAGITTLLEIDGRIWVPPGQATAGTPLSAAQHASTLMRALDDLRELVKDVEGRLTALVQEHGGDLAGQLPRVFASIKNDCFGFKEAYTGIFVPLVRVIG